METASDMWALRETGWAAADIVGFDVIALDGKVGAVDETLYNRRANGIVVDTGPWIFGRKVLLPAGMITGIDTAEGKVWVETTKEQAKSSPEFFIDDEDYLREVARHYGGQVPAAVS